MGALVRAGTLGRWLSTPKGVLAWLWGPRLWTWGGADGCGGAGLAHYRAGHSYPDTQIPRHPAAEFFRTALHAPICQTMGPHTVCL